MNLTAQDRLKVIGSVRSGTKTVTQACLDWGISRKTFYIWSRRYDTAPSGKGIDRLSNRPWKLRRHGSKIPTSTEKQVLDIVSDHPEIGYRNIKNKMAVVSPGTTLSKHGVQNILSRFGLGEQNARLQFKTEKKNKGVVK